MTSLLDTLPIWCNTLPKEPKNPYQYLSNPELCVKYSDLDLSKPHGIVLTTDTPIAVFDIDAPWSIDQLPPELADLISSTYCEISWSGKGLHIFVQLPPTEKYKSGKAYLKSTLPTWHGQFSMQRCFILCTDNKYPISPKRDRILSISLSNYRKVIQRPVGPKPKEQPQLAQHKGPSLAKVSRALQLLPIDQSAEVMDAWEALTGQAYEHYTFWITIGMSLYSWGITSHHMDEARDLFLGWSSKDQQSFVSKDDVFAKWESFSSDQTNPITVNTLLAIASSFEFNWPDLTSKGAPDSTSRANWNALLNDIHFEIAQFPSLGYFIKATPQAIIDMDLPANRTTLFDYTGPLTEDQLEMSLLAIGQSRGFRNYTWTRGLTKFAKAQMSSQANILDLWLSTPAASLPENLQEDANLPLVTMSDFLDCFTFCDHSQEYNRYARARIEAWMYQLVKFMTPVLQPLDNSGFLGLIGAEATGKTTFFRKLLPPALSFLYYELSYAPGSGKEKRDFINVLSSMSIINVEEFDAVLTTELGSFIKSQLTSTQIKQVQIYSKSQEQLPRTAIMGGTSNEFSLPLSDNGSRRLWYIQLESIDYEKYNNFSRYKFYNSLRATILNNQSTPWLLSKEQNLETTKENKILDTMSSSELELREMFDYTPQQLTQQELIKSIPPIHTLPNFAAISAVCAMHGVHYKRAEMRRALQAIVMDWTGLRNAFTFTGKNGANYRWQAGEITGGEGKTLRKYWFLPPWLEDENA
jgi:hypothetical protein